MQKGAKNEPSKRNADLDAILQEHGLKPWQAELCFFAMSGGFVRMRSVGDGLYETVRQLVFRCGMCGEPVSENDQNKHFDAHVSKMRAGVR